MLIDERDVDIVIWWEYQCGMTTHTHTYMMLIDERDVDIVIWWEYQCGMTKMNDVINDAYERLEGKAERVGRG